MWVRSGRIPTLSIRFRLDRKKRITFFLRGPEPRCNVAARFRVAGHRGMNEIKLSSVVRGLKLAAGAYRLVPQSPARGKALSVSVSKTGRVVPLRRQVMQGECTQTLASAPTNLPSKNAIGPTGSPEPTPSSSTPHTPPAAAVPAARVSAPASAGGVRGEKIERRAIARRTGFVGGPASAALRFGSIGGGLVLVLAICALLVAAARRDLRRV